MKITLFIFASATALVASASTVGHCLMSDSWEKALLTLVGTFVGASLAFLSQITLQRRQERNSELLAAHRILFCLFQQTNTVVLFQKDFVSPYIQPAVQFIEIPATADLDLSKNLFDFGSFSFLLKSEAGRKIMHDLYLAQESYIETLRMINDRSKMHRELLQPKLAEAGIGDGKTIALSELSQILGSHLNGSMVNATIQMLELLQDAFEKLMASKYVFRIHAVAYFKTADFTDFDFPETYGLVLEAK